MGAIEITAPPRSFKSYYLNPVAADRNFYSWIRQANAQQLVNSDLVLVPAVNGLQYFTSPFTSMTGGRVRLGPLATSPALLLFSSIPRFTLDDCQIVWIPSGCTFFNRSNVGSTSLALSCCARPEIIISPTLNNGGFETAGAPLAVWVVTAAGASTVTQDLVIFYSGTASARFTFDGAGNPCTMAQTALVVGRRYRVSLATYASGACAYWLAGGSGESVNIAVPGGRWISNTLEFTAAQNIFQIISYGFPGVSLYFDQVVLEDITQTGDVGFKQGDEVHFSLQENQKYFAYFSNRGGASIFYADPLDLPEATANAFLTLEGN